MTARARRRAYRFGRLAEALCVVSLVLRGYQVVARRFDAGVGEIDIVARRGPVLAVIEVKGRRGGGDGDLLTARQRARIERATAAFLARTPRHAGLDVRFDVMVVRAWRPPRHMKDAWRP
ncbi:MAG: YraN family protein [Alphaproteobacteria bacterium]